MVGVAVTVDSDDDDEDELPSAFITGDANGVKNAGRVNADDDEEEEEEEVDGCRLCCGVDTDESLLTTLYSSIVDVPALPFFFLPPPPVAFDDELVSSFILLDDVAAVFIGVLAWLLLSSASS